MSETTTEWAVRWPAEPPCSEDIEPCGSEAAGVRIAESFSTAEYRGEVVSRTVTRSPWRGEADLTAAVHAALDENAHHTDPAHWQPHTLALAELVGWRYRRPGAES